MHMTLHLTNDCNLQCSFCFVCQKPEYMNRSTAEHAVRLAAASGEPSCGIIFFGGEPLLCRDTIRDTVHTAGPWKGKGQSGFILR